MGAELSTDTTRLAGLRRLCWAAVLTYEPMVDAICELAAEAPRRRDGALPSLCAMVRRLRRDLGDDHEAAIERLIAAITDADPDDRWLERVIADLVSLQAGVLAGLSLPVASTCVHDPAFVAYLTAVRSTYFVLGVERRRHEHTRPLPGLPRG